MATRRSKVWCGFLEAGAKASAVVRDDTLDTGNPMTIYLFNCTKRRILEYRRDIVERKLRELTDAEDELRSAMLRDFEAARNSFTPRGGIRRQRRARKVKLKTEADSVVDDFGDDEGFLPLPNDETEILSDEAEI
jgi:hypothetical protein